LLRRLKLWNSKIKENNEKRRNTLGSLVAPFLSMPVALYVIKFLYTHYGYSGWKVIFILFIILVIFTQVVENITFRFSGRLGMKVIKQPYYFLLHVSTIFIWFYIFGIFQ
jgi:TctA family transporter